MKQYSIKVKHNADDQTAWIVTLYQRRFLFNKKITARWFTSEESVKNYVAQLKYEYNVN